MKPLLLTTAVLSTLVLAGCGGDPEPHVLHARVEAATDDQLDEDDDLSQYTCTAGGLYEGQRLSVVSGARVVGFATVPAGTFVRDAPSGDLRCRVDLTARFTGDDDFYALRLGGLDQAFSATEADASSKAEPVVLTIPSALS